MELSDLQKSVENKNVVLTVRTTEENKKWMDKNDISPSLLFDEAIKEIKQKLIQNVKRKNCVICKETSKTMNMGLGMESSSFCSKKCMKIYLSKNPEGKNLEVFGTRIYVK
ncbi:hypothetical protein HN865_05575 [Candidatus Woesearchaeota archaeon]|jgi:hypothetical protein|nr:hypothetical protein [Candidatus Woesearchaeota archaeon]